VTLDEGVREDGADREAEEGAVEVALGVDVAEVEAASKPGGLRTRSIASCEADDENDSGWISSARRCTKDGQQ
jgi:hypothetical protein